MKKGVQIFECKTKKYHIRIQVYKEKILKCGYLRKCGVWYYAKYVPWNYDSRKYFFENREPRVFRNVLDYALTILYYYDKTKFDNLLKAVPNDYEVQSHRLVLFPEAADQLANKYLSSYWQPGSTEI